MQRPPLLPKTTPKHSCRTGVGPDSVCPVACGADPLPVFSPNFSVARAALFENLSPSGEVGVFCPARYASYFSFAYSAFAAMRIGMPGSASFQSVRKY